MSKREDKQWDDQREVMFDAWKNSKINLTPVKEVTYDKAIVSVAFNDVVYTQTVLREDCFGSAEPYNIAFNRLLSKMKEINKDIEIAYL